GGGPRPPLPASLPLEAQPRLRLGPVPHELPLFDLLPHAPAEPHVGLRAPPLRRLHPPPHLAAPLGRRDVMEQQVGDPLRRRAGPLRLLFASRAFQWALILAGPLLGWPLWPA